MKHKLSDKLSNEIRAIYKLIAGIDVDNIRHCDFYDASGICTRCRFRLVGKSKIRPSMEEHHYCITMLQSGIFYGVTPEIIGATLDTIGSLLEEI